MQVKEIFKESISCSSYEKNTPVLFGEKNSKVQKLKRIGKMKVEDEAKVINVMHIRCLSKLGSLEINPSVLVYCKRSSES